MASHPEIEPDRGPDTIDPGSPAEVPPVITPSEEPMHQPDEIVPPTPDTVQPAQQPMEIPPSPD